MSDRFISYVLIETPATTIGVEGGSGAMIPVGIPASARLVTWDEYLDREPGDGPEVVTFLTAKEAQPWLRGEAA